MSYLSLTEHRGLLNNLVDAYQPVNDLSVINGVVEKLRNTEQLRTQQRNDTHQQLKTLTRQLDTVKLHAQRPEGTDSEEQHAQRMVELDREKFSLAKAIQTEEQEQRLLEERLQRLKQELAEIDESIANTRVEPDEAALCIKIYRNLGVEPILDEYGQFTRVRIYSPNNDVHTYTIEDKFSRSFYANLFWDMCS